MFRLCNSFSTIKLEECRSPIRQESQDRSRRPCRALLHSSSLCPFARPPSAPLPPSSSALCHSHGPRLLRAAHAQVNHNLRAPD
jgi:hypothetical protein